MADVCNNGKGWLRNNEHPPPTPHLYSKHKGAPKYAPGTLSQVSLLHLYQALGLFDLQCGTKFWQQAALPEMPAALQSLVAWASAKGRTTVPH